MTTRTLTALLLATLVAGGSRLAAQETFTSKPENLGKTINSEFDEVLPVISPDGKVLYYDRKDHPKNIGSDDVWVAKADKKGKWGEAVNIGRPLNNENYNFVCSVTPDGNTLLLGNVYNSDGTMSPGVSITHRTLNGWSDPERLNIRRFYNRNRFSGYFLANDGRTLVMSVERDDSYGDTDLYVSFLTANGDWTEPKNLGGDVNSMRGDFTPFLASDGTTLFFATDGRGGLGSADIFVSRRLDNTWQNWSAPENLGGPVNTSGWDAYFTIPASGEYAYFVSAHDTQGAGDIFRIKLPPSLRPKPVVLISGRVLDKKTKKPLSAQIVYETLPGGEQAGVARSDPETGEYKIVLPAGFKYGFRADASGFVAISDNLNVQKTNEYKEITRDLMLVPIEAGQTVRLNNLFFDFAAAELQEESYPELDRVAQFLKDNPSIKIEIAGHTDNVGSAPDNLALSQKRAEAVEGYLTRHGIDGGRMTAKGYGKNKPIASNGTEDGRQQNRRVEFKIGR